MPDSFEVVGDDLCVTHDRTTTRLSLVIPLERVHVWLELVDSSTLAVANHPIIRDQVMPDDARQYVAEIEAVDGVRAFAVVARWSQALREALGKALLLPAYTDSTPPPSPQTSGSDSASPPAPPRRSARSRSTQSTS